MSSTSLLTVLKIYQVSFQSQVLHIHLNSPSDWQRYIGLHIRAHLDDGTTQPNAPRTAPQQTGDNGNGKYTKKPSTYLEERPH